MASYFDGPVDMTFKKMLFLLCMISCFMQATAMMNLGGWLLITVHKHMTKANLHNVHV